MSVLNTEGRSFVYNIAIVQKFSGTNPGDSCFTRISSVLPAGFQDSILTKSISVPEPHTLLT